MADDYMTRTAGIGILGRALFRRVLKRLQAFDRAAAAQVDHFVANSQFVAERIQNTYHRDATVIYPPVDCSRFKLGVPPGDFYLVVAELVSYKRVDLALDACRQLNRRLVVIGGGPEAARLRARAAGSDVTFLGRVPDARVAELMTECRALLHPQIEDFGISAVEAQAGGRPVIAFGGGGALETVIDGETGLFFREQTADSLARTIRKLEEDVTLFMPERCRANSERFGAQRFRAEIKDYLQRIFPEIMVDA